MQALESQSEWAGNPVFVEKKWLFISLPTLLRVAFGAVLLSYALEGLLRFGLSLVGAVSLLYVRDFFLSLIVLHAVLREVLLRRIGIFGICVFLLGLHAGVGYLQLGNFMPVAFGIKLFIPVLAGMAATQLLFGEGRFPLTFFAALWVICAAGILFDRFFELPWTGLSYSLFGQSIEGNRLWWAGGMERLSGFTRTSWDAAAQIQLTSLLMIVAIPRRLGLKLAIWAVTGVVVFLTTTKGQIMAYSLTSFCLGLAGIFRQKYDVRKTVLLGAGLLCISLPFVGGVLDLPTESKTNRLVFYSLADRLTKTWPDAMEIYQQHSPLLGGGLGSFGSPQRYFGSETNPGDNFFIYLLNVFGLFSIAYYVFLLWGSVKLVNSKAVADRFFSYVAMTLFAAGIVINLIESPFLALFLGLLMGHLSVPRSLASAVQPPTGAA